MTAYSAPQGPTDATRGGRVFLAFAAAVVAANVVLVTNHARFAQGPAPEWPVMVDLLLFLPLLYLVVHRKRGKAAVFGALALAGLGVLAGSLVLPAESKFAWRVVEDLRFVALGIVLLFQLGVMALLFAQVARARHGRNLELALAQAIGDRFGDTPFARLLRFEGRVWLYGLFRRPVRHAFPGLRHFGVGKQGMNASNQQAFLVLVGAEMPIAHVLIHLYSPTLAMVVTALSAYGFLFMLAEYRATLHRPISVTEAGLQIRYGVAGDFRLGWSDIATVAPARGPVWRAKGRIRLVGMGEANVLLRLAPGTRVEGLFGEHEVGEVYLGVDEPAAFMAEVKARSNPVHPA